MRAGTILRGIAGKVLGIDDTRKPVSQFNAITDILSRHRFDLEKEEAKEMLSELKKKHLVDSITVATKHGSPLLSTHKEDSLKEVITGTALFNYVRSEFPGSNTVLVRAKDWVMLIPSREKVYIVRAGSNLSPVELKAIAKDVEKFLAKKGQGL